MNFDFESTKDALLVVIDMQKDFVTGVLGTKEAQAIVPNMVEFIKNFKGKRVFTKDTHNEDYLDTQEGRNLPVAHCIKDTDGWEIVPEIKEIMTEAERNMVFLKPTFGSTALASIILHYKDVKDIYLIGVCTGICVLSNAVLIKTYNPEIPVHVIGNLCACVTQESHETALAAMKLLQVDVMEA